MSQETIPTHLETVVRGNAEFTNKLYTILAKDKGNIFFSPISIHAILALAAQGSCGNTRKALCKTLNVPDVESAAEGYKAILGRLNSVKDVTLLMANKVYLKQSYSLQKSFELTATENFLSEVQQLEFAQTETAAKTINTWVEEKTKNKIKDLIKASDLNSLTRLVLVNAIYFKGTWAQKFDPANTQTEKFYKNDTETVDVQMMHLTKKFFFKEDEFLDAKVLKLEYTNPELSMIVILPNKRNGIANLEAKLANTDLSKITENMYKPEVIVALPRFKIEQTIELNDPLEQLGLGIIFDESKADFSSMLDSPEGLFVSKVVQKAFIEVNEEGAEAAAATGVMMVPYSALLAPKPPVPFIADHPFLVMIQHADSNLNYKFLFQGRISVPT